MVEPFVWHRCTPVMYVMQELMQETPAMEVKNSNPDGYSLFSQGMLVSLRSYSKQYIILFISF